MGFDLEKREPGAGQTSQAPATGGASAPSVRSMGYAQGKEALSPGAGSALVAGAAQTTELADNNGFTAGLIAQLKNAPAQGLDAAVARVREQLTPQHQTQHATVTTVGNAAGRKGAGRRHAAFIANAHYKDSASFSPLEATIGEAASLQSELGARGYKSLGIRKDQTAAQIRTAAAVAALGTHTAPGDHVVVHYGGHGLSSGLVGANLDGQKRVRDDAIAESALPSERDTPAAQRIKAPQASLARAAKPGLDPNDVLAYESLEAIARAAVGRGVHVSLLLDACHSGKAADLVRSTREFGPGGVAKAEGGDANTVAAGLSPIADNILGTKTALVAMAQAYEGDAMAIRQDTTQKNKPAALQQLTQDYMAAITSLWNEFIVPRLDAARELLTSQGKAMAAVPPLPTDPSGFGPLLAWFDDVFEATRGR